MVSRQHRTENSLSEWFCNQEPCWTWGIIVFSGVIWSSFLCHSEMTETLNLHCIQRCLQRLLCYKIHRGVQQDLHKDEYINPGAVYFPFLALQSCKESSVKKNQQSDNARKCAPLLFWRTGIDQEEVSAFFDCVHPSGGKNFWKAEDNTACMFKPWMFIPWVHCAALVILFSHPLLKIEKERG